MSLIVNELSQEQNVILHMIALNAYKSWANYSYHFSKPHPKYRIELPQVSLL